MTKTEITKAALGLSIQDQLDVARQLWENAAPDPLELSPELKEMLDARLAELDANPDSGIPWEEAHARIRKELNARRSL